MNLQFATSYLHRHKVFTFAPWLANTSHSPLVNDTSSLTKHMKSSDDIEREGRGEGEGAESDKLINSLLTHKPTFENVKHHLAADEFFF